MSTVFTPADSWASIDPPLVSASRGEILLSVSRYGLCEYPRQHSCRRRLILYLERDPEALNIRKAVLEREGYSVIGVSRREEALKTLRDSPVSLTITDHLCFTNQPSEIAREMKKIKPDVPILLFSAAVPQHFDGVSMCTLIKANPRRSSCAQ